jgi:CHAT domain
VRTILFLASNPKGTDPLRLDIEAKKVEQVLERARKRDDFKLVTKWAVTDVDLRRALLDHEPEIVHFSGHGTGTGNSAHMRDLGLPEGSHPEGSAEGGLAFENERGQVLQITGQSLARLFECCASHVRCVVLNACYSEVQANAIVQHIDYVIGMNKAVGDEAAIMFAEGFYDALMAGRPYDLAFKFGSNAIDLRGIPEHLTPVLKKRQNLDPAAAGSAGPREPAAAVLATVGSQQVVGVGTRPAAPASVPTVLDPQEVERAARALANYLGPLAYTLARKRARNVSSIRQLYEVLAEEISSQEQRKRFLGSMPR